MATPSTMVINSLIMLGAKEIGGTLTAAEQTHYLAKLNSMLESWSLERLMCYQVVEESKALTASDGTYTIGSGGDWDTARPTKIVQAWIRDSDNEDTPLKVINADSYNSIPAKTTDGTYPEYLYYDGAFVAGLASIYLYPEPSASLTLYISSWKQLQSFATISTTLVLPPGYQRAIEYNFAIEEAGGLRDVPASVIKIARESKAAIKNVNLPDVFMSLDYGIANRGHSNILNG
jgi:hypothetical protein